MADTTDTNTKDRAYTYEQWSLIIELLAQLSEPTNKGDALFDIFDNTSTSIWPQIGQRESGFSFGDVYKALHPDKVQGSIAASERNGIQWANPGDPKEIIKASNAAFSRDDVKECLKVINTRFTTWLAERADNEEFDPRAGPISNNEGDIDMDVEIPPMDPQINRAHSKFHEDNHEGFMALWKVFQDCKDEITAADNQDPFGNARLKKASADLQLVKDLQIRNSAGNLPTNLGVPPANSMVILWVKRKREEISVDDYKKEMKKIFISSQIPSGWVKFPPTEDRVYPTEKLREEAHKRDTEGVKAYKEEMEQRKAQSGKSPSAGKRTRNPAPKRGRDPPAKKSHRKISQRPAQKQAVAMDDLSRNLQALTMYRSPEKVIREKIGRFKFAIQTWPIEVKSANEVNCTQGGEPIVAYREISEFKTARDGTKYETVNHVLIVKGSDGYFIETNGSGWHLNLDTKQLDKIGDSTSIKKIPRDGELMNKEKTRWGFKYLAFPRKVSYEPNCLPHIFAKIWWCDARADGKKIGVSTAILSRTEFFRLRIMKQEAFDRVAMPACTKNPDVKDFWQLIEVKYPGVHSPETRKNRERNFAAAQRLITNGPSLLDQEEEEEDDDGGEDSVEEGSVGSVADFIEEDDLTEDAEYTDGGATTEDEGSKTDDDMAGADEEV